MLVVFSRMSREDRQKKILPYDNMCHLDNLKVAKKATVTAWRLAAYVVGYNKNHWQSAHCQPQRQKVSRDVQPTTQKRPSAHEHYVLRTNICLAVEIQKDLEFDARRIITFIYIVWWREHVHRKMLHARKTTSGAKREGRASPVTDGLSVTFYLVLTDLFVNS